jgi:Zn-finger nucleic acid-binding protein
VSVNLAVLRRVGSSEALADLWRQSDGFAPSGISCPDCSKAMKQATLHSAKGDGLTLDLCRPCQRLWFDPGEFEAWPVTMKSLSPEAERALAYDQVALEKEVARWKGPERLRATEREMKSAHDDAEFLMTHPSAGTTSNWILFLLGTVRDVWRALKNKD